MLFSKGLSHIGISLLLFLGMFFSGDAVRLSMDVQKEVRAGEEFEVSIRVDKGDLESFARFQVELPRGLVSTGGKAMNANFESDGQTVRFVWLRLPQAPTFEINYTVSVDGRLRGDFSLGGEFSFISENTRKTVSLTNATVTIKPSRNTPASQQLDIAEYQKSIPAQRDLSLARSQVRCVREMPRPMGEGNDQIVRLLVSREQQMKFAKIEEQIPAGYTAEPIETQEAIFTQEGNQVKFLWMTLPNDPLFIVSYRLIPPALMQPVPFDLSGRLSYMQDESTHMIEIVQRDVSLENMSIGELERLVRTVPMTLLDEKGNRSSTLPSSAGGTVASGGRLVPQGPSSGGVDIPVRYQQISDDIGQGGKASTGGRASQRQPINMEKYLLQPEEGVYYRVQVAAGHRPVNISSYFRRLALHADVKTERHEGWYKYSVGSFKEYKQARDYRTEVWNTTKIGDAFVAAYNNGKRITVQEALMITSQKWYR